MYIIISNQKPNHIYFGRLKPMLLEIGVYFITEIKLIKLAKPLTLSIVNSKHYFQFLFLSVFVFLSTFATNHFKT